MVSDRPSKKQKELLDFIDNFIKGNGFGPSYREIMRGLGYKSVSTVAIHVNGLMERGLIRKGDGYSARSIEIVANPQNTAEPAKLEERCEALIRAGADRELIEAYLRVLEDCGSGKTDQLRAQLTANGENRDATRPVR